VGVPVNAGEFNPAKFVATYAVVAICVVLVPPAAVGAVGVPVRLGETNVPPVTVPTDNDPK
jgi:hypothetical protein